MKYDFTTIMDRKGHDAIAVDLVGREGFAITAPKEGFDIIPMWIADMNFPALPTITDAMIQRAKHPAFGYFMPTEEYYASIIRWQKERNGVEGLLPEHIGYENGVLGGVISALNIMCSRGEKVLVHSPTYIGFTNSLKNAGYEIVHSPLYLDKDGIWRMDFADMEEKIRANNIHAAIFCSPHNPCGRVWERAEIEQAMAVYEKYDVQVVSDEIWSDIILTGHKHIPTQSVSDYAKQNTVAMYAPSKTFNLAGLVGSYHIIYNKRLRDRHDKEASLSHYNSMNVMSMHALIGAYKDEGYQWVDELCQVLTGNVNYAYGHIKEKYEGIDLAKPQGTYMLFLDCTAWCKKHGKSVEDLLKMGWDVGVDWQDGRPFHGANHIRVNLALPHARVIEAFDRLDKYVFNI
ncbi:MAG: aminotransferase class I/II-fold pyridoxal phosphate-dependent enzyme [Clostridia bacterium]|nr:aminotransferase class I/II-fold pyridoxal phosphate-dependent enzyme [Clostridia bacterium]